MPIDFLPGEDNGIIMNLRPRGFLFSDNDPDKARGGRVLLCVPPMQRILARTSMTLRCEALARALEGVGRLRRFETF